MLFVWLLTFCVLSQIDWPSDSWRKRSKSMLGYLLNFVTVTKTTKPLTRGVWLVNLCRTHHTIVLLHTWSSKIISFSLIILCSSARRPPLGSSLLKTHFRHSCYFRTLVNRWELGTDLQKQSRKGKGDFQTALTCFYVWTGIWKLFLVADFFW